MSARRPRSLMSLLMTGSVLLIVPFVLAVGYGVVQLRRLADQGIALVQDSVETTRLSQELLEDINAVERAAGLYALLQDPRLLDAYDTAIGLTQSTISALEQQPISEAARTQLALLVDIVKDLQIGLSTPDSPMNRQSGPASPSFQGLNKAATAFVDATLESTNQRLEDLESQSSVARERLLWSFVALAPVALALAWLFFTYILRPVRRLDRTIADLGVGELARPILVHGPSDLQALGRRLEWLRVRLLEVGEEKNRFLRHMSHELKTPLANVREGTDLLLDGAVGPLDANQLEVAGILRENAIKLQRLIENLLSYSAWQSRSTELEVSQFTLSTLVGTVTDSQRLALAARDISLDISIDEVQLAGDRKKLRLVLDNLLSNALKFTPRGGTIHIYGRIENGHAVIDFADTGPGVPESERARVFEDFYSGTTPHSGPLKGTGIGLSVVREFVQAHGGTVEIADGVFDGAHFRLRLPLHDLNGGIPGDANAA